MANLAKLVVSFKDVFLGDVTQRSLQREGERCVTSQETNAGRTYSIFHSIARVQPANHYPVDTVPAFE